MSMALDHDTASALGRLGAQAKHARHDPGPTMAKARAGLEASWVRKAREEAEARGEQVTAQELERRAHHLREAHFARMRLNAQLAKWKKKQAAERQRARSS